MTDLRHGCEFHDRVLPGNAEGAGGGKCDRHIRDVMFAMNLRVPTDNGDQTQPIECSCVAIAGSWSNDGIRIGNFLCLVRFSRLKRFFN
jgi:hypothetical protein